MTAGATLTRSAGPCAFREGARGPAAPASPDGGGGATLGSLTGYFSAFNVWYRADDGAGAFLERVLPGAYLGAMVRDRQRMRVLLQHGKDPLAGDRPLGTITTLEEDAYGARYEVQLFDNGVNREILPALQAGQFSASMRFMVELDDWVNNPGRSQLNPDGIPERTIRRVQSIAEFGPVTFPANPAASAGVK